MKISFYDTFIVPNFKNSHFTPNNYKGIVLKIRDKNTPFSAFMILLLRERSKTTFIIQNFKNSHFTPNTIKGIVLQNRVQNQWESAFMILLLSKTLKTLIFPK